MSNTMFDLSSEDNSVADFNPIMQQGENYAYEGQQDQNYFDNSYYNNQQVLEVQPESVPSYLYQPSSVAFPVRPQSYIEQNEQQPNQVIPEVNKVESLIEEEQVVNVEIKQQQELLELCNDHLQSKEEEDDKQQQNKSQNEASNDEEPQFFRQEFNDIYEAAFGVVNRQIFCFPPPYFRNFVTPKSMAPPSLEVIQKNKSYYSLGNKIDFSSIYQKPDEAITNEEKAEINTILTPNKNIYDVMQEIMSSIMNKSVEILKHSQQGGQQLNEYITEMESLVRKFAILCKISKIKLAKFEVMNIFENEKSLFQKSADQINTSISQIKRFKESLKINEVLNSKNPEI